MPSIQEQLERLAGKKRGKGRLPPAAPRAALPADTVTVYPTAESPNGGGIASPLTEQAYTGETWKTLTSSDGLFVFEYGDQTEYVDGNNDTVTVVHL